MSLDTEIHLVDLETGYTIAKFGGTFDGRVGTGAKSATVTRDNKTVIVTNYNGSEYRYSIEELKNRRS